MRRFTDNFTVFFLKRQADSLRKHRKNMGFVLFISYLEGVIELQNFWIILLMSEAIPGHIFLRSGESALPK